MSLFGSSSVVDHARNTIKKSGGRNATAFLFLLISLRNYWLVIGLGASAPILTAPGSISVFSWKFGLALGSGPLPQPEQTSVKRAIARRLHVKLFIGKLSNL
jgi:hypothetical protein